MLSTESTIDYLRNAWYAAIWSESLETGALVPRTILNQPLVLFRKEDGSVAAMRDACPHRFAPLSAGKLLPGSKVQCIYHGLQFDATGQCVENPHGRGRIPSACKVPTFSAVEKHSMVWVWMGAAPQDESLIPDYSFLDSESGLSISRRDHVVMDANYRLVMNNLLDLSHAPLLHEGILAHADAIKANIRVKQDGRYIYVERPKSGIIPGALQDLLFRRDGQPVDVQSTMRWSAPCHLLNNNLTYPAGGAPADGAGLLGAHILTPINERQTLYHFAAAPQGKPLAAPPEVMEEINEKLSSLRRMAFEEQDEPMIEAQQRYLDHFPSARPVFLEIDEGPVKCNRILDALIAAESQDESKP